MFTLITGLPGSSKTSHLLLKLKGETKRPIYYRGIRGLKLPWNELTDEQAKRWHEEVPPGAIFVCDEAQELWPVRASSKPVPHGLEALETHRHKGWDVYFISQDPTLLDSHARKLCNEQFHYVRPFQGPYAIEYHSGSGYVSPSNRTDLNRCATKRQRLPKEVWDLYDSADQHTHTFSPPKIIYILAITVFIAAFAWWRFFDGFSVGGSSADTEQQQITASPAPHTGLNPVPRRTTSTNWQTAFTSEIPGLPYTAPIYEELSSQPTTVPVVHGCMSMRSDFSDCRCFTQQGTRIADMPNSMCKRVLQDGLFNHLAARDDSKASRGRGDAEERSTPAPGYL